MNFSSTAFCKNIMEDRYEPYLKECVSPLDYARSTYYSRYLIEVINQIQIILAGDQNEPQLKCKILDVRHY